MAFNQAWAYGWTTFPLFLHIPADDASTVKVVSLLAIAFCSPEPCVTTLLASDFCCGTPAWYCWVVLVLVTVSTTTWDCSVHAPGTVEPEPSMRA